MLKAVTNQVNVNQITGVLPVANGGTGVTTSTGTGSTVLSVAPTLTGDVTLSTGNLIIGTSGKGIDFSATPSTGTSELLNDYEEGAWTPIDGSGAGLVLTVNWAKYTKIGRVVSIECEVVYPVTADASAARLAGLPYSESYYGVGAVITNASTNVNALVNGGGKINFQTTAAAGVMNSVFSGKYIRFTVQYLA